MKKKIAKVAPLLDDDNLNNVQDLNLELDDDKGTTTTVEEPKPTVPIDDNLLDAKTNFSFNESLKGLQVFIQCHWIRIFTEPTVNKYLCIRSYDRTFLAWAFTKANETYRKSLGMTKPIKKHQIGELTGNYAIDAKSVVWLEMINLYCDRRVKSWVRERDVWHALKNGKPNGLDWEFIPYGENGILPEKVKSKSWIAWLIPAISILSSLK